MCKFGLSKTLSMSEFWVYFQIGVHHIVDISAYDHLLFLVALAAPYAFADWRKVLVLISMFTLGHCFSMLVSIFAAVPFSSVYIEFLIGITILVAAVYNIFTIKKVARRKLNLVAITALAFGIIHGFGFSGYFNTLLGGSGLDKIFPLISFASGIEMAQVIIVISVMLIAMMLQKFARFNRNEFVLLSSGIVLGLIAPIIYHAEIWTK